MNIKEIFKKENLMSIDFWIFCAYLLTNILTSIALLNINNILYRIICIVFLIFTGFIFIKFKKEYNRILELNEKIRNQKEEEINNINKNNNDSYSKLKSKLESTYSDLKTLEKEYNEKQTEIEMLKQNEGIMISHLVSKLVAIFIYENSNVSTAEIEDNLSFMLDKKINFLTDFRRNYRLYIKNIKGKKTKEKERKSSMYRDNLEKLLKLNNIDSNKSLKKEK